MIQSLLLRLSTVICEGGIQGLFEAEIIVAGGRGAMGDNMQMLKNLAEDFKKQGFKVEWVVNRVMVDEGVVEYARQIGQIGKIV